MWKELLSAKGGQAASSLTRRKRAYYKYPLSTIRVLYFHLASAAGFFPAAVVLFFIYYSATAVCILYTTEDGGSADCRTALPLGGENFFLVWCEGLTGCSVCSSVGVFFFSLVGTLEKDLAPGGMIQMTRFNYVKSRSNDGYRCTIVAHPPTHPSLPPLGVYIHAYKCCCCARPGEQRGERGAAGSVLAAFPPPRARGVPLPFQGAGSAVGLLLDGERR